jgi:hypothetical protein
MAKPIYLTFKREEEIIYDWICSHSNKGGYIKDLVKADMEKQKKSNQKVMKGFLTLEE